MNDAGDSSVRDASKAFWVFGILAWVGVLSSSITLDVFLVAIDYVVFVWAMFFFSFVFLPLVVLSRPTQWSGLVNALFAGFFVVGLIDLVLLSVLPEFAPMADKIPSPYLFPWNLIHGVMLVVLFATLLAVPSMMILRASRWRVATFIVALLATNPLMSFLPAPNNPEYFEALNMSPLGEKEFQERVDSLPVFPSHEDAEASGLQEYVVENESERTIVFKSDDDTTIFLGETTEIMRRPDWAILASLAMYFFIPFPWIQRLQRRVGLA